MNPLFDIPMCGIYPISNSEANGLLAKFEHKLGPCERPFRTESFALKLNGEPIAVAMTCSIVHGPVAGFQINEVVELARLASSTSWANRVMIRLWREICAPNYKCWTPKAAVSYSHNGLHSGSIYRTDGWEKVSENCGSDGKGGNWGRRGKGYANPTIHGKKTLWVWRYPAAFAERVRIEKEGGEG
jgi:hypothetical protein